MTGRLASCRVVLRVWPHRWLMLALPLPLLALGAPASALAPSGISHGASARSDQGLFPPFPRASGPAPAIAARFAVIAAAVSGGEHALSRPRRARQRWRVEP